MESIVMEFYNSMIEIESDDQTDRCPKSHPIYRDFYLHVQIHCQVHPLENF